MPQVIPTHINAYYRDLQEAKKEVAIAQQRVDELEAHITASGHVLPTAEVPNPQDVEEDVVTPDAVSAVETPSDKPVSKMNRAELNAKANEVGVESPEQFETNKDVIEAIKAKEGK